MKKITILVLLYFLSLQLTAQTSSQHELRSDKTIGGLRQVLIKTSDSGYAVAGNYDGLGDDEICVVKTDVSGNLLWRYIFQYPFSDRVDDYPSFILQDEDSSFLVGAYSDVSNNYDYIFKLDKNGNLLWAKRFLVGDEPITSGNPVFAVITKSKDYLVTGRDRFLNLNGVRHQVVSYAMLIDKDGNLKWKKNYYKRNLDILPIGVVENENKTYTIGGNSQMINIDSVGNLKWARYYKRDTLPALFGTIVKSTEKGYFLAGSGSWVINGVYRNFTYLIKTNSLGKPVWARSLENNGIPVDISSYFQFKSVAAVPGGGCFLGGMVTGKLIGNSLDEDLALAKFTNDGTELWQKQLPHADYQSFPGENSLIRVNDRYLFYAGSYSGKPYFLINDFANTDEICNSYTDTISVLSNDDAISTAVNLKLLTDSIGSLIDLSMTQTADETVMKDTVLCTSSILPLHLLSFTAQHNGKTNLLKWSTAEELNTDHFEIQRSNNSRDFVNIGTVRSLNNGKNTNDYAYTDAQPLKAINYYRLKMIDKDGKFTYSAIKNVNNIASFDVTLYPNPVKNLLTLNFNAEKTMDMQIEIVNAEGRKIFTQKMQLTVGASVQKINATSLSAGQYFIKCISADGQTGLKFVKQ